MGHGQMVAGGGGEPGPDLCFLVKEQQRPGAPAQNHQRQHWEHVAQNGVEQVSRGNLLCQPGKQFKKLVHGFSSLDGVRSAIFWISPYTAVSVGIPFRASRPETHSEISA